MAYQQDKRGNSKLSPRAKLSNTLLNAVRYNCKERRARELIEKGADVNFTFDDGKTLLLHAISYQSRIVSVLIDAGADVNATDDAGKTALMYCAQYAPYNKVISTLLQKNANVNIIDKEGKTAVMYAALHNKPDLVTELLEAGADVIKTDNEGRTALMYAAQQDSKTILTLVIKAGVDVNISDVQGITALMYAALYIRPHLVAELLDAGADVSKTDKEGRTALMHAAQSNKHRQNLWNYKFEIANAEMILKTLIDAGADVSVTDNKGKTALNYSIEYHNEHLACALINAGADVNVVDGQAKTELFLYSSRIGNQSVVQEIVNIDIDINVKDDQGKTALIYALQNENESLVHALLDAGADHSVIDNDGQSALFFAAISGNESVVQRLIKAGADLNITDKQGKTALMYATQHDKKSIACALLDAGADHSVIDNYGKSAFLFAAISGNESVVQRLMKAGANLNITDNQGKTALIYAIQHHKENIACALLDAGADHSVIDKDGQSALFFTAISGIESVVQRLIKAGADLNIVDNKGKTALKSAIQHHKENIACALLDAGADHSVIDEDGQSALFFTAISGIESVVQRLIKAGADINTTDNKGKTALIYFAQNNRKWTLYNRPDSTEMHYISFLLMHKRYYDCDHEESDGDKIAIMLIEAGADVNATDDKGKTALIYAVENYCENLACALIDAGGNVNITDKQGKSALSYSIQTKNFVDPDGVDVSERMACKLIKAGADVDIIDDEGETPLMYAVQDNKKKLTAALIGARVDVNICDNNGKTALMHSLQSEHDKQESLALIKAGADVNISDHEGQTALFYGLADEDAIHALIEDGHATVNKRDRYGRSVLFYSFTRSVTITHYILKKGGNLNVKDNCTMSIISFCIENLMVRKECFSIHFQKLNTLVEKRIHTNAMFEAIINSVFCKIFHCNARLQKRKGRKRRRPAHIFDVKNIMEAMHVAKKYVAEQAATKKEKIQKVIEMMKEDRYLYTNLEKIADLLVELGANPHYADADGNTALHYATCLPLVEPHETTVVMTMCHKLEDLGVSFNAKNHKNETPLLFCLSKKEWINTSQSSSKVKTLVDICKYLLEHGSSVEETTRSGKSVFHLMLELFQEGIYLYDEKIGKEVLAETMKILELFPCSKPLTEMTVNKRDANLNSPLHLWAMLELNLSSENYSSNVEHNTLKKSLLDTIFKHLVARGVKLNDRNKNEETPMHLCRSWTAAKLLIDAGANPKVLDSEGSSPLIGASKNIHIQGFRKGHFHRFLFGTFKHYNNLFSQEQKEFWKTVLDHNLDPWAVDNHGISVLSILIQEEAFALSKALVEVACEVDYIQSDTIASSILNAVCQDSSTRKQWKSILVEMILKSRKAKPISYKSNEDTALHLCCRNIVKPSEESEDTNDDDLFFLNDEADEADDEAVNSAKTSVQWTIAKQLLTYGMDFNALDASGQSCLDIANKCPALKSFLLKPLDIDEVPLAFPWTSISTKYKPILSKVARRQECKHLDPYWYHETNIQKGSFGLVFAGMNEKDGREVAIKRIEKLRNQQLEADKKEIKTLTALADCGQVVRYLSYAEDEHFCYVILELMEGNLDDYLNGAAFDDTESIQLCGDVLNGLKYLHQQNILHRDLKPSNILFKTYPKLCLKISDFGLSRRIDTLGTSTTSSGSVVGTRCWIAPEVLKCSSKKTKHQMACDVFSAGLVLYYILSGKKHPFTPADCKNKSDLQISNETEANIIHDRMESFNKSALCPEATDLMHNMLNSDSTKRPTAAMALTLPFFWPEKKKMDFLSAVGNQPEFECPRAKRKLPLSNVEIELDGKLKSMIMAHPTWDDPNYVHMPTIYTEMTYKRKSYDTSSVVELVRLIRNTIAHVSEDKRPTLVKELVLQDFVFLEYFPNLVMEVFKCVKMHGWDSREEIKYQLK